MSLYLYRLRPAFATAFGASFIADERLLSPRARSRSVAVSLRLEHHQALELARGLQLANWQTAPGAGGSGERLWQ